MSERSFNNYRESYEALSFISKLAAFLLAVFAALSLFDIARFLFTENYGIGNIFGVKLLFPATVLQLLILIVFALKFASLFFESKRAFKLGQILRLVGIFLLLMYFIISLHATLSSGIYSTQPGLLFRHASPIFNVLGAAYLILSPLRQTVTLVYALIKIK